MIPNDDQLKAISHMHQGSLAEIPFAVLLHALAVQRATVVLEIERSPIKKSIVFEKGVPVDCRSNMLHETLSRFMVDRGDLTEDMSQQCLAKRVSMGLQIGEVLILEGLVTASELYKILQLNLAKKLLDGFTWRTGEFRILPDPPQVESPLKVNTPQLVVTGISKFAMDEEVNEAVGPLVGKRLFVHPSPPFPLSDIRLNPNQNKLIELLKPGKRIDELAADTTIPFDKIMRLLYALSIIGIVVEEDRLPSDAEIDVELPSPSPTTEEIPILETQDIRPVEIPHTRADAQKEHDALMQAYLRYRKLDAFDLLGLEEEATMQEIDEKFIEYSTRFAPWKFDAPGLSGLVEKARDLFLAGGAAYGELSSSESRNSLLIRRRTLRDESKKVPARERFAIRSELLDPAVQFKKGKSLMQKGRYQEAIQQLSFALDCDPQNSKYRAELAYCRFLESPDTQGESSLEELKETLRIDPRSGLATYYAGMIHSERQKYDEGERLLQKAIKMMMPDRRPIEGLKELQARRQKKRRFLG